MRSKERAGLAALLLVVVAWSGGARSGPLFDPKGGISEVRAGVFCVSPPDGYANAPDATEGSLNVYNDPFRFALTGDRVPAQPRIGIGVVVRLEKFREGEFLRVRVLPPAMPSEEWDAAPDAGGRVWFGYLGEEDASFPAGNWRFELLRGRVVLMSYDFVVVEPPAIGDDNLRIDCSSLVS